MNEPGSDAEKDAVTGTAAPVGGAGRRGSLVTIDQVISGLSNLIPVLWVAHALSPGDFGRFSLVLLVYLVIQATLRALVGWTVLVHPEDADGRPRAVLGSTAVLSTAGTLLFLVSGAGLWFAGSAMGPSFVAVGLMMPLLGSQDVGRFLGIGQARPGRALVLDLIWLALMLAGFATLSLIGQESLLWFVLAWAGSGAIAGLWTVVQYGVPHPREINIGWLRDRWSYSSRSFIAATSSSLVLLVGSSLMAVVSGPMAIAAVRAALLLERPSVTVQIALSTAASADIAREQPDNRRLMAIQRRTMLLCSAVAAANLVVLLLLPDWVGRAALGQVWPLISPLLLLIGIRVALQATQSGVRAALLGRKEIGTVMVIDIASAVVAIIGLVIGAAIADGEGALWGSIPGLALATGFWWIALRRHLRRHSTILAPAPAAG